MKKLFMTAIALVAFNSVSMENNFSIIISTVLGQKVFEKSAFSKDENSVDLTTLAKGTYFVTFSNSNQSITKKLIIK